MQTGQIFHINARLVKGGGAEGLGRFSGGPVIQNLLVMHLKVVVAAIPGAAPGAAPSKAESWNPRQNLSRSDLAVRGAKTYKKSTSRIARNAPVQLYL